MDVSGHAVLLALVPDRSRFGARTLADEQNTDQRRDRRPSDAVYRQLVADAGR
jgi:hypothetical protein